MAASTDPLVVSLNKACAPLLMDEAMLKQDQWQRDLYAAWKPWTAVNELVDASLPLLVIGGGLAFAGARASSPSGGSSSASGYLKPSEAGALRPAEPLHFDGAALANQHVTNSGTTVLGRYPLYIEKAEARGASYFDLGSEVWDSIVKSGRDPWELNLQFLDGRIAAQDTVLLSVPKSEIIPNTYLGREVDHLLSNGYGWVNQWSLRPGG